MKIAEIEASKTCKVVIGSNISAQEVVVCVFNRARIVKCVTIKTELTVEVTDDPDDAREVGRN